MFEIVNRTSFNAHLQKPVQGIPEPPAAISLPSKSQAEMLMEFASNVRAKQASYEPKILKKPAPPEPPKVETVQEVAERIKEKRLTRKENAPLPVQKELRITYKNKRGEEFEAYPTQHSLIQFQNRIRILKPHLVFSERKELMASFSYHFMKSQRISERGYNLRNKKRREADSPFVIGDPGRYAFIVKPDGTILTFELIGKYRKLNKIHSAKKIVDTND